MNPTILLALLCFAGMLRAQSAEGNCSNPLSIGTFNTLQIFFAQYRDERLDALADYFTNNQQDLQVLCLQEIWQDSDRQRVISGLQSVYPYSYYAPRFAQTECSGGCSTDEIRRLKDCSDLSDCISFSDGQSFTDCIENGCRDELESVSAQCGTCLVQDGDLSGVFRNLDNCFSDDNPTNQNCYAFDGWSDSLILSKIPFVATDFLPFSESPITYTTALFAAMDTPNLGRLNFVCTHLLPADLPLLTVEQATNLNQTMELLNWVNNRTGANETTVLLGDFNHGPGNWPENYDALMNGGYSSAYTALGNSNCTYCASNPLASDLTAIIDHVYVRNAQISSSNRFATYGEYTIDRPRGGDGERIPISDHYGVRATLCPGTTQPGVPSSAITVQDTDIIPDTSSATITSLSLVAVLLASMIAFL